jgi:long-chain acyl-CoA synthetase
MFNLAVILRESASATPDRPVAYFDGGHMTYGQLDAMSDRFAAGLIDRGVAPGDPVGLQLPNVPQFLVAYFGILKAGAVVVPMNVLLKADEVAHQLSDSGARALVTWVGVWDEASKAADHAGAELVIAMGGEPAGATPFDALLAVAPETAPFVTRELTDTAVIIYTSGTTGRPKGAELTHIQLYLCGDVPGRLFDISSDDVLLATLPLFHVFAMSTILNTAIRAGATLSLVPRFDPEVVLKAIERDRITIFLGVPTMFAAALHHPELDKFDISSLRIAVSGGASIPESLLESVETKFGITVLEGYGLTETVATATFNRSAKERRVNSVGKPVWGVEVEVWDDEGRRLPAGADNIGEIVTRGFNVMKGYRGNPEATAEAFGNGWFHTGDLGYFDEDGFLFIVDRKKELIIRGGYNVYPREVEEVIYRHAAIAEAAVIGVPDERLGEEVHAVVAPKPGFTLTEAELIEHCKANIAAYKYPRSVEIRAELPKNATGKILKKELSK